MSHRADRQKVLFVSHSVLFTQFVQFAARHARRRNKNGFFRRRTHDFFNRFFAAHPGIDRRVVFKRVVFKGIFADNERVRRTLFLHRIVGIGNLFFKFRFVIGSDRVGNLHRVKKFAGYLSLLDVLRLIVHSGFPAPADDQQHRHRVYVAVGKGQKRIGRVSDSGILHIHERYAPRRKVKAGRKTDRRPLVCRNNVLFCGRVIGNVGAKRL